MRIIFFTPISSRYYIIIINAISDIIFIINWMHSNFKMIVTMIVKCNKNTRKRKPSTHTTIVLATHTMHIGWSELRKWYYQIQWNRPLSTRKRKCGNQIWCNSCVCICVFWNTNKWPKQSSSGGGIIGMNSLKLIQKFIVRGKIKVSCCFLHSRFYRWFPLVVVLLYAFSIVFVHSLLMPLSHAHPLYRRPLNLCLWVNLSFSISLLIHVLINKMKNGTQCAAIFTSNFVVWL